MDQMAKLNTDDDGAFLRRIAQIEEIDFNRIPGYNPPSKDPLLLKFARESEVKYIMSTSTISSALSKTKSHKKLKINSFRSDVFPLLWLQNSKFQSIE